MSEEISAGTEIEKFRALIDSEVPDLGKIKELLSSNPELFSKEQREAFMRAIYSDSAGFEFYGFKDLSKLQVTLQAIQELHAEGKVSTEQFKYFLTAPLPESGSSVLTQVALNVRANEFKTANIQDEDALNKLAQASESYDNLLEQIGKIDKDILNEVLAAKDSSKLKVSFADLSTKSPKLRYFMDNNYSLSGYGAETSAQNNGDDNTLTVSAAENSDNLRVGGQPNEQMTVSAPSKQQDKQIADMHTDAPKDKRKPDKIKISAVKEQDIIEFMFNEWFLAAINWSWEKIVNLAQDGVNALFANYDTGPRMPVSAQNAQAAPVAGGPQPTQPGQSAQAGQSSLRDETALNMLANLPSQLKESINQKYPIYQKGIEDIIRHNIGKAPQDWAAGEITYPDGTVIQPLDLANPLDIKKIENWNALYAADKNKFMQNLQNSAQMLGGLGTLSQVSAHMAVADYLSNPKYAGKPLDDKAVAQILKMSLSYLDNFNAVNMQIQQATENEYRIKHHIDAETQLDKKALKEIANEINKRAAAYLKETAMKAAALKKDVTEYFNPGDEAGKAASAAQIKVKRKEFLASIQDVDKYLTYKSATQEKTGLDAAAAEFNRAEHNERTVAARSETEISGINQQLLQQQKRRGRVQEFKRKFGKNPSLKDWRNFINKNRTRT